MGCASSKRVDDVVDVYRPAPSSFAVFDVSAIDEPWKNSAAATHGDDEEEEEEEIDVHDEKMASHVPAPILEKLKAIEDAPRSWDEVSKALEDIKPKLHAAAAAAAAADSNSKHSPAAPMPQASNSPSPQPKLRRKSFSFHTLEELESRVSSNPKPSNSNPSELRRLRSVTGSGLGSKPGPKPSTKVPQSLKDNIFIIRDKEEREKEGKPNTLVRFNPLSDFPELSPPGGDDSVVFYTSSLGGIRRTQEDCFRVRHLLEIHQVVFDERDVALDIGFLIELRDLLGDGAVVPRVFVKGRYIGGADEVLGLNETGRLSRILNWARVERGVGRLGCGGCGGARFVPCLDCGGSCKVMGAEGVKERCGKCNENGLVHCPICI